jgi:predicted lipid-binding transport protein (Tim44 family)
MGFDLGGLLQQYLGGNAASSEDTENHFKQVSQNAPTDLLSQGLAAMFRSDQTPAFGQLAGQLFGQSNPNQQAGMLSQLLGNLGPGVLTSLVGGASGAGLAGILGKLTQGGNSTTITPEQASQLSPEQVQELASHAEKHTPSVVDSVSSFYAEHSGLLNTLGSAALAVTLAKMASPKQN